MTVIIFGTNYGKRVEYKKKYDNLIHFDSQIIIIFNALFSITFILLLH